MRISGNLLNTEKQTRNVKMQHMFQKSNELNNEESNENFDIDNQYMKNMSKIVKSYRSFNDENNIEIKTNSLVSCAKGLLETQSKDMTKSLDEYLDEIKTQYKIEKNDVKKTIEKEIIEDQIESIEINFLEEEDVIDPINIDDILKSSEKDIYNTEDQRSLLRNLIDDININSNSKSIYDDTKFEKNINDIIKESQKELKVEDVISESSISFNELEEKKRNSTPILLTIIVILLIIAGYSYKDIIFNFVKEINIQEIIHEIKKFIMNIF